MTHETARIVSGLREALATLKRLAKTTPSLQKSAATVQEAYSALEAHLDYARVFIDATQHGRVAAFEAEPQVKLIAEKFGAFAEQRSIEIEFEIEPKAIVPSMPIAVYSGILLNLYTNALKAIVANHETGREPKIMFKAYNDVKWHTVEILDTGLGIPPNLRTRVWDPLFTTTSRLNNPLGSGMGLGLPLIRELVEQVGGRVEIVDAPKGYTTCFRVQFPLKKA